MGPPIDESRSLGALGTSAAVHAAVILWIMLRPLPAESAPPLAQDAGPERQQIALAPPAQAAPAATPQEMPAPPKAEEQKPEQPKPEPPQEATPLGPDSKNPDALVPKEAGPEKPVVDPDLIDPNKPVPKEDVPAVATPPEPEPAPATAPKAVRRIGTVADLATNASRVGAIRDPNGRPAPDLLDAGERLASAGTAGTMGRVGPTSPDNRDWRPSWPEAAGKCVEIPLLGNNPDGTPVLATVIGRVLGDDGRSPLAGAHLQIIGTAFSTFSDGNGNYRLEFDPKLLQRCRVQYVRVAREGFSGQLLTLAIGKRITSDDVVLRRR